MANLGPQHINQSFGDLLQLPNGLTPAIQNVQDGSGNVTPLEISTTVVDFPISSPSGTSGMISDLATDVGSSYIGFLQTGTGAVTNRSLQDKGREWVSVIDFGAAGNGITDDYQAIFNAVLALDAQGGGDLIFPQGVYAVTHAVPFRNNISYIGMGMPTIKAHPSSTDGVIGESIPTSSYSNIYMENFIVDGNNTVCAYNNPGATDDQYQNGVRLVNVSKSTFVNVRVQNTVMNGWSLYGGATDDNTFIDCWATNIGKSTNITGGASSYYGIYNEVGGDRNTFIRPKIDTTRWNAIADNVDAVTNKCDNAYIDAYITNYATDGSFSAIYLWTVSGTARQCRTKIIRPVIVNSGSVTNQGIVLSGIAGAVEDTYIENPFIDGTPTIGISTNGTVYRPQFVNVDIQGIILGAAQIGILISSATAGAIINGYVVDCTNTLVDNGSYTYYDIMTAGGVANGVGQVISNAVGTINFPANNTYGDATSISLPSGVWEVSVLATASNNGATSSSWRLGVSTSSGNNGAGLAYGTTIASSTLTSSVPDSSMFIKAVFTLTATTTVYAKIFSTYSAGTPNLAGVGISATKIR